nr:hypothetical protein [Candidatus Freyarchaeota archaeon]
MGKNNGKTSFSTRMDVNYIKKIILFIVLISAIAFSSIFLINLNQKVILTFYLSNIEYLWVNMALSLLVHIFMLLIFTIMKRNTLSTSIPQNEEEIEKSNRWLHLRLISLNIVKFVLTNAYRFQRKFLSYGTDKTGEGEKLNAAYLILSLLCGFSIGLFLVLVSGTTYTLYASYLTVLIFIIWFIIGLGTVRYHIKKNGKDEIEVDYSYSILKVEYKGIGEKTHQARVGERTVLLGLSVNTGFAGIITTIVATVFNFPLIFALIPVTFDMLSVISALLEYPGLKVIPILAEKFKKLPLNLTLISSGSLYISGLFLAFRPPFLSETFVSIIVSMIWIFMAALLSIIMNYIEVKQLTSGMMLTLGLLPLIIIIINFYFL